MAKQKPKFFLAFPDRDPDNLKKKADTSQAATPLTMVTPQNNK
jgi:hypothetical protein